MSAFAIDILGRKDTLVPLVLFHLAIIRDPSPSMKPARYSGERGTVGLALRSRLWYSEPRIAPLMLRRLRRLWKCSRNLNSALDKESKRPRESRVLLPLRTCSWNSSNATRWLDLILK
jgi:hypothetical protein